MTTQSLQKRDTGSYLSQLLGQMEWIASCQPHVFDELCGKERAVVLYGAGGTGRKLARLMKDEYRNRLFITDQREDLWGRNIDGIPVLSPVEATKEHGAHAVFVITVFNREPECAYLPIVTALKKMGASQCVPWPLVAWKYADRMLPRYFLGSASDILPFKKDIIRVFSALTEQRSQVIFLELLEASLTAPFERLSEWEDGPQYFIPEILQRLPQQVSIVDCGAYDGDSLRDAMTYVGAERIREYHAFEPDVENFRRLKSFVADLPQDLRECVTCYHAAVGRKPGFVSLALEGTESSFVSQNAAAGIPCMTLDTVLMGMQCDYIKMDIEGYEKEALLGAASYLRDRETILAISAYHRPDDFFAIPLCIQELCGGYGFFRKHYANLFDTVYYHF